MYTRDYGSKDAPDCTGRPSTKISVREYSEGVAYDGTVKSFCKLCCPPGHRERRNCKSDRCPMGREQKPPKPIYYGRWTRKGYCKYVCKLPNKPEVCKTKECPMGTPPVPPEPSQIVRCRDCKHLRIKANHDKPIYFYGGEQLAYYAREDERFTCCAREARERGRDQDAIPEHIVHPDEFCSLGERAEVGD